jgi:AraC-like DNA-binding protein/ActR/RegA family two-component response regulator
VVLNLVTNAIKFTARGYVMLAAQAHDENITISVSDTGLGVPAEEHEAIFDEFRQSERTAARGYGGLGIGLAICRQLIELHGGQIGVRSSGEENSGSTFYFTLPIISEPTSESTQTAASDLVLILTETSNHIQPLQDFLTREGFHVKTLCFDQASDWLSQIQSRLPGAVVLDCPPNSSSCWQWIDALKSNALTQDIPVLFSSFPSADTGAMLALDYVTKPLDHVGLARALARYGVGDAKSDVPGVVLVVDDDPSILEMHTRLVQSALPHHRVLQATNGRLALELMHRETPSLVLLDLMMPELNGMGVLAAMQENENLRGVPVIVLTAQVLTQQEMVQLNKGVSAILQKGLFTTTETLTHIKQVLAQNKHLGTSSRRMVAQVVGFIHEHYAEPISRDDMASYVGVSARHLTRCFHAEMGISPITYLNRYRVKKAKQLLEMGDQSITEIAEAVGFSSSNYFTDAFRRETGISPRDYRRGH